MTPDSQHTPEDRAPHGAAPAPGTTSRLGGQWDDAWRSPAAGAAVGLLTLPAVALVLVGLVVLALEGEATWLLVVAAALVTTTLGALCAIAGLRRRHPAAVHRLAVLTWVWGVLVVAAGIVVALMPDVPSRGAVAVLLVLGGAYTLVLGLGLWGAARVMPTPDEPTRAEGAPSDDDPTPARRGTPAEGDEENAEWPEWGGADPAPGRSTAPTAARSTGRVAPRSSAPAPAPSTTSARARDEEVVDVVVIEEVVERSAPPERRSATSAGGTGVRHASQPPGPATERIARQDGDGGPPTQRIPPVVG